MEAGGVEKLQSLMSAASLPGTETITRQMAQFFEATSDGVFFLNRDFIFIFLNRRAQEILAPSGEVIGRSIWEAFPEAAAPGSPYWMHYHHTMNERLATHFEAFYPEPLNILVDVHCFPSEDGVIIFFRDITEERRVRDELTRNREEIERQYAEIEAVYRTAPIGLALFDLDDYHYLRLNDRQAAFFGLKPEQIVGRTLTEMAPIEGLRELFDQVAHGGPPIINYPLEGTLVTDPTEHRYWTVSYYPVLGADGTIQGITAASLEITHQRKAELALIESDKLAAVGRMAASIAHEINNPLEAITNLLYLASHSATIEDAKQFLEIADKELRRVAAVTNQTLRFHKQSTNPQEISAQALADSVLAMYYGRISNSHVSVHSRYRTTKTVRCFEGEIRQVFANLLNNALDALPSGGSLFVRARNGCNYKAGNGSQCERGMVLTLADTGTGMSAETLEKVFRPFFTTKGMTGTGLGLWISKEILDRHHGAIRMRSRVGTGTVVSIFLPYKAVVREP